MKHVIIAVIAVFAVVAGAQPNNPDAERHTANIDNLAVHALINFTKSVEIVSQRNPRLTPEQAEEARAQLDFAVRHLEAAIKQASK